jgi:hypothetical protein
VCIGLESDRAGLRTLEKSSQRDRDRVCAKFESSRRFRGSNMNPKKKPRWPRPRPRFSDLSFHSQPWSQVHILASISITLRPTLLQMPKFRTN